jgi:hypothetical protein
MKASKMSISAPKPANQGGHGSAPVQPAKIQKKIGAAMPGASTVKYSVQPAGTKGTNKGAK